MYVLFFSRNPADFRNFVSYLLCLQNVNEKIYVNNSVLYFNSMRQENERKKKKTNGHQMLPEICRLLVHASYLIPRSNWKYFSSVN